MVANGVEDGFVLATTVPNSNCVVYAITVDPTTNTASLRGTTCYLADGMTQFTTTESADPPTLGAIAECARHSLDESMYYFHLEKNKCRVPATDDFNQCVTLASSHKKLRVIYQIVCPDPSNFHLFFHSSES